jgi:hypothetical protein
MSSRKFAAMTGSLLARKGEASPSSEPYFVVPPVMREVAREVVREVPQAPVETPPPAEAVPARSAEAPHKIAMRLSEAQHLRLRVAAAQMQVTRQALLAAALDHYLTSVCASGRPDCACLRGEGGCGCAG